MVSPVTNDVAQENIRIMVVEDVDFNLDILASILAERGWQVVGATSGEAALAILAQDLDFQVILMDIGLPGIDGIEATRRIKENPATRAIPVIALTAETASERDRFLAAGLDGYAEKNFEPAQLFAVIERLCPACGNQQDQGPALTSPAEHLALDFKALLATYGDKTILARIAKAFFADTDKELLLLGKAMAESDQTTILACCHSLKGACSLFTAQELATAVTELDSCIRAGKRKEAFTVWDKVVSAQESLREHATSQLNLTRQNA
ncbi:response regulator [Thiovibrio frasassiensis]|uniref:Response regulator n=1 Tax=Thiovibrio frasassiensis TaxID=2984131 RepID=A0A9X4MHX0_9BACT|nr:response regulator [Thiovibrio frasassiensis]MDG4476651.1 response regulator [Thiovibrio frasassiensis]